jgi:hypothetical protein
LYPTVGSVSSSPAPLPFDDDLFRRPEPL